MCQAPARVRRAAPAAILLRYGYTIMYKFLLIFVTAGLAILMSDTTPSRRLIARVHPSGFPQSHDTYNGMGTGSDGRIYYVLCSELPDVGARMYALDPATAKVELLGDLT